MTTPVQIAAIICFTIVALVYAFVLLMWLVAKYKK